MKFVPEESLSDLEGIEEKIKKELLKRVSS
jgi:hypothetical protein